MSKPRMKGHLSKGRYKLINARSDTAAEKPSCRSAFKSRRCLIRLTDALSAAHVTLARPQTSRLQTPFSGAAAAQHIVKNNG
jgi:putative SOS response-associated peptidase YedK